MWIRAAIAGVCDDSNSAVLWSVLSGAIWPRPASAKLAGGRTDATTDPFVARRAPAR